MLLIASLLFVSLPMTTVAQTTLPAGCTSKEGYSPQTGVKCDAIPETTTSTTTETTTLPLDNSEQATTDFWPSDPSKATSGTEMDAGLVECLKSTSAPNYVPTLISKKNGLLVKNFEVVRGIPFSGCADMDLPDRMGGRGWVRFHAGTPFVFSKNNLNVPLRLRACGNDVYRFVAFKIVTTVNKKTTNTTNVYNNYVNCKSEVNKDGTTTLTCGGAKVIIKNGVDGKSCQYVDNGDGSYTIQCEGQESFTIRNGKDGKNGFCSGKGCKTIVVAIIAVGVVVTILCILRVLCPKNLPKAIPPVVLTERISMNDEKWLRTEPLDIFNGV